MRHTIPVRTPAMRPTTHRWNRRSCTPSDARAHARKCRHRLVRTAAGTVTPSRARATLTRHDGTQRRCRDTHMRVLRRPRLLALRAATATMLHVQPREITLDGREAAAIENRVCGVGARQWCRRRAGRTHALRHGSHPLVPRRTPGRIGRSRGVRRHGWPTRCWLALHHARPPLTTKTRPRS